MGEKAQEALKLQFDKRLRLEFHGARITSDVGLLACQELDWALGRKVFEMLQHGASCGSWVFGFIEALTASENRLTIATLVDMGNSGANCETVISL